MTYSGGPKNGSGWLEMSKTGNKDPMAYVIIANYHEILGKILETTW